MSKKQAMLDLFRDHLPKHRKKDGTASLSKIALSLGISRQAVSQWPNRGRIPPNKVNKLINLPGSTLTQEMLFPFVDLG